MVRKFNMKKFVQISMPPLILSTIAALLFAVDALIAPLIVPGASFMWVAFVSWTVFFAVGFKDRIKAMIGYVIGYLAAIAMFAFGGLFDVQVLGISIAGMLGVFLVNFVALHFENFKKVWMNSMSGLFVGMFLVFSGLGIGMNPLTSVGDALTMLGIIMLYGVLGLLCGLGSIYFVNKFKKSKTEEARVSLENEDELKDRTGKL